MGNTGSSPESPAASPAGSAGSFDYRVDAILENIPTVSVNLSVFELRSTYCKVDTEDKLEYLAKKLIYGAVGNSKMCCKYVEIAKELSNVTIQDPFNPKINQISFKDIFVKLSIERLESFLSIPIEHLSVGIKNGTGNFFGQLFVCDMVSSSLMFHWVQKFKNIPDVQNTILSVIKEKVTSEYNSGLSEQGIDHLWALLSPQRDNSNSYNRAHYDQDEDDSTDDELKEVEAQIKMAIYQSNLQQVARQAEILRAQSAAKLNVPTPSFQTVTPTPKPSYNQHIGQNNSQFFYAKRMEQRMEQNFRHFLMNISNKPPPTFDLNQFKTSTDADRRCTAKVMLELAMTHPENAVPYANIVRVILCQHSLKSTVQKTFGNHLNELLDLQLITLFSRPISQDGDWARKKAIGIFIGELFIREAVKKDVLHQWLSYVLPMVPKNDPAIQIFVSVLKIIMDSLKQKDEIIYKGYLKILKVLREQNRIPKSFMPWTEQMLTSNAPLSQASSRLNSEEATSSTNATKITPKVLQPNATTVICSSFQKSLNALQSGQPKPLFLNFGLFEEPALKGCALILLEHAWLHPDKAKVYAALTANSFVPQMNKEKKMKFINFLAQFFEAEICKCFKLEAPEKSNWARIKTVGPFLSELYNFEVVDVKLVTRWIEPIYQASKVGNESALEALLTIQKMTAKKMNEQDSATFNVFITYAEQMSASGKIPKKFSALMKEVLTLRPRARSTEQPPPESKVNCFEELNKIVHKMNFGNHSMILNEILALNIPESDSNSRKIANILITKTRHRFDLIHASSEILMCLPEMSTPPMNQIAFSKQVELTLLTQYNYICSGNDVSLQFINFTYELHAKNAINLITVKNISEQVAVAASNDGKVPLVILLNLIKVFRNLFGNPIFHSPNTMLKTEKTLRKYAQSSSRLVRASVEGALLVVLSNDVRSVKDFEVVTLEQIVGPSTEAGESSTSKSVVVNQAAKPIMPERLSSSRAIPKSFSPIMIDFGKLTDPVRTKIGGLREIVEKMDAGNHAMILDEILELKFPESNLNSRVISYLVIAQVTARFDLVDGISEILMQLPKRSSPPMDQQAFSEQVGKALLSFPDDSYQFTIITRELYAKKVIDLNAVKEIVEHLADASVDSEEYPLLMLLNFIRVFQSHLVPIGTTLRKTEETLNNHYESPSSLIRTMVKRSLEKIFAYSASTQDIEVSTIPAAPKFVDQMAKQSSASQVPLLNQNLPKFSVDFFRNDIDEFKKNVEQLDIRGVDEMNEFALSFYRAGMKSKDFVKYVRLAQVIDSEISSRNVECQTSFKESLCQLIQAPHSFDRMDNGIIIRETAVSSVKFASELYKIGWFGRDRLKGTMDALAVNDFETQHQIEMFHSLIRIVSLNLVKNGDGDICREYQPILQSKVELLKERNYILCLDILDIFSQILSFDDKVAPIVPKATNLRIVELILSNLRSDNIPITAAQLLAVPLKNHEDLDQLVHLLAMKATRSPDEASIWAKLIVEVQELSVESSDGERTTAKDVLVEKCQEILLNNINGEIKLHQMDEMLGLLKFICELYTCNILNSDFINLCLDLISEDDCDNAVDCVFVLMTRVGAKVDADKLEPYFKKFEEIVNQEESYRSTVYKSLIELRNNNWKQAETDLSGQHVDVPASSSSTSHAFNVAESSFEMMLSFLTEDKLKAFTDASIKFISKSKDKQKDFVKLVLKCILMNSEKEFVYAELCNQMRLKNKTDTSFSENMIELLSSRTNTLTCLQKGGFHESSRNLLATLMIFIGELYRRDFISNEVLEGLLKPAKHLSFHYMSKLVSIIAPKINGSNNVRLMALLITFDDIAYERSIDFWKVLKEDIGEINEIVSGLHLSSKNETESST